MNKWDQLTHVRLGKQKKKENLFFFCPFNVYNYNHNLAESLQITIKSVFKKQ